MSQYSELVEQQRVLIAAEEWALSIKSLHAHSLDSMWYDDRPQDTEDGSVIDTTYNDGTITRTKDGKVIHTWKQYAKSGEELMYDYQRATN